MEPSTTVSVRNIPKNPRGANNCRPPVDLSDSDSPTPRHTSTRTTEIQFPNRAVKMQEKWNGSPKCAGGFALWKSDLLGKLAIARIDVRSDIALTTLRENVVPDQQGACAFDLDTSKLCTTLKQGLESLNRLYMKQFPDSTDSDFTRRLMNLSLANYGFNLGRYINAASNLTLEYLSSKRTANTPPTPADNDMLTEWQKTHLMPAFLRGIPIDPKYWDLQKKFETFSDCAQEAHKLNAKLNYGKGPKGYADVASAAASVPAPVAATSRPRKMATATTEPARLLRAKDKTPSNTLPLPA